MAGTELSFLWEVQSSLTTPSWQVPHLVHYVHMEHTGQRIACMCSLSVGLIHSYKKTSWWEGHIPEMKIYTDKPLSKRTFHI